MDYSEIERRVLEVIVEQFNLPHHLISSETSLQDDLGADSLALTELVARLEDRFETQLPDFRRLSARRVGELVRAVAVALP